jgi:hypothetical protein
MAEAAELKPSMTEWADGAAEIGAVAETAVADGSGRMVLLKLLGILGAEDGSTGRGSDFRRGRNRVVASTQKGEESRGWPVVGGQTET